MSLVDVFFHSYFECVTYTFYEKKNKNNTTKINSSACLRIFFLFYSVSTPFLPLFLYNQVCMYNEKKSFKRRKKSAETFLRH